MSAEDQPLLALVQQVRQLPGERVIVAISGFGGSGKSTLAESLQESLDSAFIVPTDSFHTNRARGRSHDWASIDRGRLQRQVLEPFRTAGAVRYQIYDWITDRPGRWTQVQTGRHLIVEGVGLIHPDVMPFFDFTVWVDCSADIALERAIARDRAQGAGQDDDANWRTVWAPNDADFNRSFRPQERADVLYSTHRELPFST